MFVLIIKNMMQRVVRQEIINGNFQNLKKIEPLTSANLKENDNHQNCLENLQRGQLYFDGTDYYICHIDSKYEIAPPTNTWNWTKINSSK